MTTTTGHLLIGYAHPGGWLGSIVRPATFTGNGLALHAALGGPGWAVTHVSSGLQIRTHLALGHARYLLAALAEENWTFAAGAVTADHAAHMREICDAYRPPRRAARRAA